MKKGRKNALIAVGVVASLLVIYILFGFYGVPYLLKNTLPSKLRDINASLSVQEARFNPFTFELNVTNPELNTTSPLFSAGQIDVKLKPFSIFKKLVEIDILRLESPSVRVINDKNSSLNLAPFLSESNASDEQKDEKSGINFALNNAKILNGSFVYDDESLKKPFSIKFEDINYEISGINTKLNSIGKHAFDSNSSLAQKLDWQGGIDLAPLRIYGVISVDDFDVRPVAISFIDSANLKIKSALVNTKFNYELTIDENKTLVNLKDSFLNLKSVNVEQEKQSVSIGEFNVPNIELSGVIGAQKDISLNINSINLKNLNLNGDVGLSLSSLALNSISSHANIDENGKFGLEASLKNAGINGINLAQNGLNLLNLKDINASDLNVSLTDNNLVAGLKSVVLSGVGALVGKGEVNLQEILISEPRFTQENNVSLASVSEVKARKIGAKVKNKEFASVQEMSVSKIKFDLLKTALAVDSVSVDGLKFISELTNDGLGAINALNLAQKSKKDEKDTQNELKFNIENIAVNAVSIELDHIFEAQKIAHKFDNLNLSLQNVSSDPSAQISAKLDMKSSQKLNLSSTAKITPQPLKIEADVKLNDANLPRFFAYAKSSLDANLKSGKLDAQMNVKFEKNLSLKGKANIADIALYDAKDEMVFAFKSLDVAQISLADNSLNFQKVVLDAPFVMAHLNKDREFNLSRLVKNEAKSGTQKVQNEKKDTAKSTKKSEKKGEFDFAIKDFSVKNATLDFSDASLFMPFATKISNLNGKLSDIDKNHPAIGEFQGVVGKGGFSKITTKLFIYEPKQNTNIKLDFKDIDLVDVTPYSGQFIGYKIEKGKLNLNLTYEVLDSKLNGSNVVNFDSLTLGEKVESKDAVNLPLSLAISILSDQDNQINIDLPVEGDLNDPNFKYGGVIWAAVKKLFADITLAPFNLLGNMLGLSSKDLSSIDFLPNSTELINSENAKIADFVKLTTAKPKMKLLITPTYSDIDELETKNKRLENRINLLISQSKKDYMSVLASLAPDEKSTDEKVLRAAALKTIKIEKEQLIKLANERAQVVKSALVAAGIAQERLVVTDKVQEVDAKQKSYVGVLMGVSD